MSLQQTTRTIIHVYMQAKAKYDTKKQVITKKKGDSKVKVDRQGGKGVKESAKGMKQLKGGDGGLVH